MGLNPLVDKIRAKYPEYADISDEELTSRVLKKYPEYGDLAVPKGATANVLAPDGTVRAIPGDSLGAAIQAGGKIVHQVAAPSGDVHWIPGEELSNATKAGGILLNKPAKANIDVGSSIADKILGEIGSDDLSQQGSQAYSQRQKSGTLDNSDQLNSFEGSYSSGDQDKANAMTGAGVAVGTTLVGAGLAPKAVAAWNAVPGYMKFAAVSEILHQLGAGQYVKKLHAIMGAE